MSDQITARSVGNFSITPKAEAFIRTMVRYSGKAQEAGFRLQVTPGGCSGMSADFSIEDAAQGNERSLQLGGVNVFIPLLSYAMLEGITIDYVDSPTKSGFTFTDPKKGACACSSSSSPSITQLEPLKSS
jgi:iron-sulfur cluster assembly accessory protein